MFYVNGYVLRDFSDLGTNMSQRPNVHCYLQELNRKALRDYDVITIGELSGNLDFYECMKYIDKERKELSMVFHSGHLKLVREAPLFIVITSLILFRTKD
jgi:glycosidase